MRVNILLGGLLASALVFPVLAQSQAPNPPASPPAKNQPAATAPAPAPSTQAMGWRASKLIGLNVYNEQNEKLGDISEILVDKSGKIDGVIIGVGGFLGMGERLIKVELSKLKFVDEPVRSSATTSTRPANAPATTTAPPAPANTTGTGTNRPASTSASDRKWYPDHAVLAGATKDQLKAMPEFKY